MQSASAHRRHIRTPWGTGADRPGWQLSQTLKGAINGFQKKSLDQI